MNCLAQRKKFKNKHPAWTDSTDENYKSTEQSKDEILDKNEVVSSGNQSSGESDDDDDDFDMYANDVRSNKLNLETKDLRYKFLTNINNDRSFEGGVQQVQFHPKSKISLITLMHGQADLFEIDGERNRYIQNIKLPKTRSPFCSFTEDGNKIVISSETYRGNFYTYDMVSASIKKYMLKTGKEQREMTDFTLFGNYMACRKDGSQEILGLSSRTYENVFSVKLNEPAKSIQFTTNNEMFIAGENARVYVYDLRKTVQCKHRFQDEGAVHSTSLAISELSNQISIGSDSGIVNTYELSHCLENKFPTPTKSFCNLKSNVDILLYNNSGELLLMATKADQKAFRLVHSHSGTVYKNFPKTAKQYGRLLSAAFSPSSGYLGLGCSTGRAHLCRIPYYKSY